MDTDGLNKENWGKMVSWICKQMKNLMTAIQPHLDEAKKIL
jgi:hypothetical protein